MGKLKIKLLPNGSIEVETKDVKGRKCLDYVNILSELADIKIEKMQTTDDYFQADDIELDDSQHLSDN